MDEGRKTKVSAIRRFNFCAGHRVYEHESKCANMHGHEYELYIHVEAPKLDRLGRVQDFSVIKSRFLPFIEERWDHGFLWYEKDSQLKYLFELNHNNAERVDPTLGFHGMKNYKCQFNPTAENMALFILEKLAPVVLGDTEVKVTKVVLWETKNCYVEVSNEFGVENIQSIEVGAESRS